MSPVYKTKFGIHIDLSRITAISEPYFGHRQYCGFSMSFEIDLQLFDKSKTIIEAAKYSLDYVLGESFEEEGRKYITQKDGEYISDKIGNYLLCERILETKFGQRVMEMYYDLLNAWISWKNEHPLS